MRTMTWPSGLKQPVPSTDVSCRARPLPDTIRPCRPDPPVHAPADRAALPLHHVAACCVVGTGMWVAVIAVGRIVVDVLTHLG